MDDSKKPAAVLLDTKRILLLGLVVFLAVTGALLTFRALDAQPVAAGGFESSAYTLTIPAKAWYFAEGYTGEGFEEWLLAFNPRDWQGGSGEAVKVRFDFYNNDGYLASADINLPTGARTSLNVKQFLVDNADGYQGDVSAVVTGLDNLGGTLPIICERALYFEYGGRWTGGSQTLGYPAQ